MKKLLRKIWAGIENAAMARGNAEVRRYLLQLSDRQLADRGFSRELLEQGLGAWPWRIDADERLAHEQGAAGPREVASREPAPAGVADDDHRHAA